jgi:hypothetical protein
MLARCVHEHRLEVLERIVSCRLAVRRGNLTSPAHSELHAQDVGMSLSSPRRDAQLFGDFQVRTAGCDEADDLALPLREPCIAIHAAHGAILARSAEQGY